jgi:uncharacterized protein YqeY
MTLSEQIKKDLFASMKAGDSLRTSVLRMLLSEMNYKQIELQRELNEADILGVISREVKKRKEAIESFTAGGRTQQAAGEEQEMAMLKSYLPQQMSEEEIRKEVMKITERLSDQEKTNFGLVMKVVAPELKGRADGALVAKIVKDIL